MLFVVEALADFACLREVLRHLKAAPTNFNFNHSLLLQREWRLLDARKRQNGCPFGSLSIGIAAGIGYPSLTRNFIGVRHSNGIAVFCLTVSRMRTRVW